MFLVLSLSETNNQKNTLCFGWQRLVQVHLNAACTSWWPISDLYILLELYFSPHWYVQVSFWLIPKRLCRFCVACCNCRCACSERGKWNSLDWSCVSLKCLTEIFLFFANENNSGAASCRHCPDPFHLSCQKRMLMPSFIIGVAFSLKYWIFLRLLFHQKDPLEDESGNFTIILFPDHLHPGYISSVKELV